MLHKVHSKPPQCSFELFPPVQSPDTWQRTLHLPLPFLRKLLLTGRVPSSPTTSFAALLWRQLLWVCYHPYIVEPRSAHSTSRWGCTDAEYSGIITSSDGLCCVWCTPGCGLLSWLPGHTAASYWVCHWPADPFLQACSPATPLPVYIRAPRYSVLDAESWNLDLTKFHPFPTGKEQSTQTTKWIILGESIEIKLEKPLKPSHVRCFSRNCMQKDHKQPHRPTMFPFRSKWARTFCIQQKPSLIM